jgi:aspartyl-tRNA(Asn)/glutamyl-tRNA(Gln) amidotransferase subunit A
MSETDLCYLSATELIDLYKRRTVSPVEVTEVILERIEHLNPKLNAFITVTPDLALKQAQEAEIAYRSDDPPALAGVPVSLKDHIATKDIRTTSGSLLYSNRIPGFDAPIVERLRDAGAILLGKTNMPELGWKGGSGGRVLDPAKNPWNLERTAGGSSGGAAASVAAGLGPLAQGSDAAGSIRIPASFCGIFGLKPSWGLIPQFPVSHLELLSHLGPMTRTVEDAALMLQVMAGADPREQMSIPVDVAYASQVFSQTKPLRIAWSLDLGYAEIEPEVRQVVAKSLSLFTDLGYDVEAVTPRIPDPWDFVHIIWASSFAGMFVNNFEQVRDQLEPGLIKVIEQGQQFSSAQLANALARRSDYYRLWRLFMEPYDILVTPTVPIAAFQAELDFPSDINGVPSTYLGWTKFTYPFNVTGQPAASVPCGRTSSGLPVGLQLVGRWREDLTVLQVAAALEKAAPWRHIIPPI